MEYSHSVNILLLYVGLWDVVETIDSYNKFL